MSQPCSKSHPSIPGVTCSLAGGHAGKHLSPVEWAATLIEVAASEGANKDLTPAAGVSTEKTWPSDSEKGLLDSVRKTFRK